MLQSRFWKFLEEVFIFFQHINNSFLKKDLGYSCTVMGNYIATFDGNLYDANMYWRIYTFPI